MKWIYDDGGRSKYFKAANVRDCAIRAVAIATEIDYLEVYKAFKELNKGKSCRNGTPKNVDKKYLKQIGWIWHPTMTIGQKQHINLCAEDLPSGRIIVRVAHHLVAVIDGVLHDTWKTDEGKTCVYGYWTKPEEK